MIPVKSYLISAVFITDSSWVVMLFWLLAMMTNQNGSLFATPGAQAGA